MWMGAVKKAMLLILNVMSIAQVIRRRGIVSPQANSCSTGFDQLLRLSLICPGSAL